MKPAIAILFLVAGVALLVAWLTGGPPPEVSGPRGAPTAAPESGDTAAWASKAASSSTASSSSSTAPSSTPPKGGAEASAPTETKTAPVDAKAGLEALARVAAAARAKAAARAAPPAPFPVNKEGIQGAMRAAIEQVKECYEPWVQMNPELQGKLTTSFVISKAGGAVEKVHIAEGGLGSDALDGCVLSVLEGELRFEAPENGEEVTVSYPLTFRSADPEQDDG